jgi:hypothetical protein
LKTSLFEVRFPLWSKPPTVKRLPSPNSATDGYQRASVMFAARTYCSVPGSKIHVSVSPPLLLLVAGLGYALVPPSTRSHPSARNA